MPKQPFWIAFGDLHDNITRLQEIPLIDEAVGIIITGDITFGGGIKQARQVLEPIAAKTPVLLAQIGNMDRSEITGWLEEKGWNLHARARELFDGIFAIGVGCSPSTPFGTPSEFPESQLAEWMQAALDEAVALSAPSGAAFAGGREAAVASLPGFVLVSHTPPYDSACDRLRTGVPVGSTAVRDFIEKYQPDICLCGHIHESRAEQYIGKTHVMNMGTLKAGGYAVLRHTGGTERPLVHAELKVLR